MKTGQFITIVSFMGLNAFMLFNVTIRLDRIQGAAQTPQVATLYVQNLTTDTINCLEVKKAVQTNTNAVNGFKLPYFHWNQGPMLRRK